MKRDTSFRDSDCPPALAAEAPSALMSAIMSNHVKLSPVMGCEEENTPDTIKDDQQMNEAQSAPDAAAGNRSASERDAQVSDSEFEGNGVVLSNTPPQSSQIDNFTGSEDWFEINLYVDWDHKWAGVKEVLSKCKEFAASDCDDEMARLNYFTVSGFGSVEVDRMGARLGDSKKGPYFAFRLFSEKGLTVLISDRAQAHKTMPNVIVRVDGEYCLYHGARYGYEQGISLIKKMGGYIQKNKLSRADLCLDMPGVSIYEFIKAYKEDRYLTRSKHHSLYVSNGVSVGFGSSALKCRIYDKLAEVIAKANPVKALHMRMYRWGGMTPKSAIRVEFQLRRETIKNRSVDTVEDYFSVRSDLIQYLTHQWLRFSKDPIDRANKHQSRAVILPLWILVQQGFQRWAGLPEGLPLVPIDKEAADVSQLIKQAAGVLYSAAMFKGKTIETWQDFLDFALPQMELVIKKKHNIT